MLRHGVMALFLGFALTGCHRAPPPRTPADGESPIVVGTQFAIESEILGQARTLSIYLPHGYDRSKKRFPVLYLIDGGALQDYVPVAGLAALATLTGQYPEFIIVGVQTEERSYELTTPSDVVYDRKQIRHNGGADDFLRHIIQEVQPLVNKRYRTSEETLIMGESLAGLFIVDTFLRHPNAFDHYIAVSPSVWWREGQLARSAKERLKADGFPSDRSIYLAVANETDIVDALRPLVAALESDAPDGLKWWFEPMPNERHNTIYQPAALRALRLLLAPSESEHH